MTDSTALGDRMKRHEAAYRAVLPRRTYTVLRVDIRAAHSLLRDAERPFDAQFAADMDATAEALCKEITGAVMAYTQSDEISVLSTDFGSVGTEPWFGGVVAKQVSIAAAVATAELNARRPGKRALFDARVFTLADPVEVANYFLWRQRDAVRNSISMAAQARFSHRELHGVNSGQMQDLLHARFGINWNDYPDGFKRGRVTVRQVGEREVEYVDKRSKQTMRTTAHRTWWETTGAPHFTTEAGSWLGEVIPQLPQLKAALDGPAEQLADAVALPLPEHMLNLVDVARDADRAATRQRDNAQWAATFAPTAMPEPVQPPTWAAMAELAERARAGFQAEQQQLESSIRVTAWVASLTVHRTEPVEQIAGAPAALDRLTTAIAELASATAPTRAPGIVNWLTSAPNLPLVPDETLPPGGVHLRPHPRPADGAS